MLMPPARLDALVPFSVAIVRLYNLQIPSSDVSLHAIYEGRQAWGTRRKVGGTG